MNPVRTVARPMISWLFVTGGLDALRNPGGRAQVAGPTLDRMRDLVPQLPGDNLALVRVNGAAQVVAGGLFARGTLRRLSALVLAGSLVPTTFAGHSYWTLDDPAQRAAQRIQFNKNLSILGGLLLAVADSDGRRSSKTARSRGVTRWRVKH